MSSIYTLGIDVGSTASKCIILKDGSEIVAKSLIDVGAGTSGPKGLNYIYGLGGRDVRVESIQHVFAELEKIAATGEVGETYRYLDVRE